MNNLVWCGCDSERCRKHPVSRSTKSKHEKTKPFIERDADFEHLTLMMGLGVESNHRPAHTKRANVQDVPLASAGQIQAHTTHQLRLAIERLSKDISDSDAAISILDTSALIFEKSASTGDVDDPNSSALLLSPNAPANRRFLLQESVLEYLRLEVEKLLDDDAGDEKTRNLILSLLDRLERSKSHLHSAKLSCWRSLRGKKEPELSQAQTSIPRYDTRKSAHLASPPVTDD